jgi:hypothetical protein
MLHKLVLVFVIVVQSSIALAQGNYYPRYHESDLKQGNYNPYRSNGLCEDTGSSIDLSDLSEEDRARLRNMPPESWLYWERINEMREEELEEQLNELCKLPPSPPPAKEEFTIENFSENPTAINGYTFQTAGDILLNGECICNFREVVGYLAKKPNVIHCKENPKYRVEYTLERLHEDRFEYSYKFTIFEDDFFSDEIYLPLTLELLGK